MENAIRHNKTPEERKAALEEALRRVRPVVLGHNEPVGKRLEQFANRPIDEQTKTSDRKKALKPLSLAEMAKKGTELEKKAEKAGIDLKGPGLAKDIEEKNKEKKKEKEKDKEKELKKTGTKDERNVFQSQTSQRHGNSSGRTELGFDQQRRQAAYRRNRCYEYH